MVTPLDSRLLRRVPLLRSHRLVACGCAALLSVAAGLLRLELDPFFPPGFPFVIFFPAVLVSTFLFGRGPGTIAAILGGAIARVWFMVPFGRFHLDRTTAISLLSYAVVVSLGIALVHLMQRANAVTNAERERSDDLAAQSGRLVERSEVLFRELQHRVSNNLQMVGAVLNLQKRDVVDPSARLALDQAADKLQLIGRIQRQLYDMSGARVALDVFLIDLVKDLMMAGGKPGITSEVDVEPGITLKPDALIPLALIMAEGIGNALEHGFADRHFGRVVVVVRAASGEIALTVTDDGNGLPSGFSSQNASSLGLKIASTLSLQLGGTFEVLPASGGGTMTRVVLPCV